MDARVGHVLFPIRQVSVLRRQALERSPLDRVVLRILDARFHLALVPGRRRFGRQNDRAVMPGELLQLGMEFRIIPIGLQDTGLEVVWILFPTSICAQPRNCFGGWARVHVFWLHIFYSALSHFISSASSRQTGFRRHASEEAEVGGWHACNAASFIRRLISA